MVWSLGNRPGSSTSESRKVCFWLLLWQGRPPKVKNSPAQNGAGQPKCALNVHHIRRSELRPGGHVVFFTSIGPTLISTVRLARFSKNIKWMALQASSLGTPECLQNCRLRVYSSLQIVCVFLGH